MSRMRRSGKLRQAIWVAWSQAPADGLTVKRLGHGRGLAILLIFLSSCEPMLAWAQGRQAYASWYSCASAKRESGKAECRMANGEIMDGTKAICASWDYPFQTTLEVTGPTEARVRCVVQDRGPARRLYRRGRILDLSRSAFAKLSPLSKGVIPIEIVEIEEVK